MKVDTYHFFGAHSTSHANYGSSQAFHPQNARFFFYNLPPIVNTTTFPSVSVGVKIDSTQDFLILMCADNTIFSQIETHVKHKTSLLFDQLGLKNMEMGRNSFGSGKKETNGVTV